MSDLIHFLVKLADNKTLVSDALIREASRCDKLAKMQAREGRVEDVADLLRHGIRLEDMAHALATTDLVEAVSSLTGTAPTEQTEVFVAPIDPRLAAANLEVTRVPDLADKIFTPTEQKEEEPVTSSPAGSHPKTFAGRPIGRPEQVQVVKDPESDSTERLVLSEDYLDSLLGDLDDLDNNDKVDSADRAMAAQQEPSGLDLGDRV